MSPPSLPPELSPLIWERLAKLASMALVKVGSEDVFRAEFDGLKFVELLRGEAERLRRLHDEER